MKILEYFAILFISTILTLLCIAPFLGVNYLTQTITDLGFFKDISFIHDTFALLVFLGSPILIFINTIKRKYYLDFFYLICFILFGLTFEPIFEWMAFLTLNVYILKEIILSWLSRKLKTGHAR